jgi:Predicted membrane protein
MAAAVLLIFFLVVVLLLFPAWAFLRLRALKDEVAALRARLATLESELRPRPTPTPVAPPAPVPNPEISNLESPPSLPPTPPTPTPALPPVLPPPAVIVPSQTPPPEPKHQTFSLEHFVGAKLFAWLGGLTAFLAVAFFLKYSFEHDLISPQIRVTIGFALSAALIAGGLRIPREKYRITSHVLCATGVVSLYAVTFACHTVYRFAPFTPLTTFALLSLITAAAFLLAVRLPAPVVALLGLLGGFLTPFIVSTGEDNPLGLFTYIALLDLGLAAVALHRRWHYLVPLAAAGTVLTQLAWTHQFFQTSRTPLLVTLCLAFSALFFVTAELARRLQRPSLHVTRAATALPLVALAFACYLLGYTDAATRPALFLGFVFAADAFLLLLSWRDALAPRAHLLGGAAVFALLGFWTVQHLTPALLRWTLAACVLFAAAHTALPLFLARRRPDTTPTAWGQLFPPVTLLLLLVPLFKLDALSLAFWPAVLLVDLLAIALAFVSGSLLALAVVLALTLAAAGVLVLKTSPVLPPPDSLFLIIAFFAVVFFAAGLVLARRFSSSASNSHRLFGSPSAQISAFAALLPFILLVLMSQRLALPNPAPLFAVAALLCVLLLALTRLLTLAWLPICGLLGLFLLEFSWHTRFFTPDRAVSTLAWYLGFHALFAAFPFFFRRAFANLTGPWATAALSGFVQFLLVYPVVAQTWPNDTMGLLPAAFALPPALSLTALLRVPDTSSPARLNQLAWFGGITLLFLTLILPIQFERQWLTVAWALEGAALLWLFHRIPHPGLRATGVVLLALAFTRLALNGAVFSYQPRGDTPLLNWYLYTYGLVIACLFTGARLVAPPRHRVFNLSGPALLNTLGVILSFFLLNLEIADFFTPPGSTLSFEFSGNFARDLAYTIAWSLFALGLLAAGIRKQTRAARLAAIALLGVTLLKLFLHDLAELNQLYRVGALIAVAIVAIVASFLYQRFALGTSPPPR